MVELDLAVRRSWFGGGFGKQEEPVAPCFLSSPIGWGTWMEGLPTDRLEGSYGNFWPALGAAIPT